MFTLVCCIESTCQNTEFLIACKNSTRDDDDHKILFHIYRLPVTFTEVHKSETARAKPTISNCKNSRIKS